MTAAGLCLWLVAAAPASAAELTRAETRELEQLLVRLGFNPGLVDGVADARTTAAIEAYQGFAALRVDGMASRALLDELRGVAQSLGVAVTSIPAATASPGDTAETSDADGEAAETDETAEPETAPPAGQVAGPVTGKVTGAPWDMAVHLASFRQEAKAHTEWQRLQRRLPNLFGDMESRIGAFDLGEEGLFFRLYAGPFPNLATAQDFCITVSLEGFNCGIARGEDPQIAAASPAAPEAASEAETQEPPPEEPTGASVESEAVAEAEAAAAAFQAEAAEAPPGPEESAAAEPSEPAESPETQDEVVLVLAPGVETGSSPSAPIPEEPTEEAAPAAAAGAPTALVAAEQLAAATETAPESAPEGTTTVETEDGTLAATGAAEGLAETGPSEAGAGGPTLLIATTQFAERETDPAPGNGAEEARGDTSVGSPTLLATLFDFGVEDEEPSARPEPQPARAPANGSGEAGEPEAAVAGAAEVGSAAEEPAATAPTESTGATEPEAIQTAAAAQTAIEDYMTATAAFQTGDCTTALRHYERAFEKGGLPREALASGHNNRGRCHYGLGHYDEALADFDRAIGLDENFAAAYYNRGRVHTAMGHSAEARADLKSAYDLGFGRLQTAE